MPANLFMYHWKQTAFDGTHACRYQIKPSWSHTEHIHCRNLLEIDARQLVSADGRALAVQVGHKRSVCQGAVYG